MRSGRVLVVAAVFLLVAGCTSDAGEGSNEEPSSSISVRVDVEEPTEVGEVIEDVEVARPTPTASDQGVTAGEPGQGQDEAPTDGSAAPQTGPQLCRTVTSTIGEPVTVEILAGEVDCAFAENLLDTYYNDPPSIPEGSGAYLTIDGWECNSSSSQEPGRVSTCRAANDALIIAIAGEAPEGGWCALIDDLTLDQLVAGGEPSEAVCATYIGAETSVDQQ